MKIQATEAVIRPGFQIQNKELGDFFQQALKGFHSEMNFVLDEFYSEEPEWVFALIERTFVGIWNNALIKTFPSLPVIQEFSVWGDDNKNKGRCDYFVKYKKDGKKFNLVFEAKQYEADGADYGPADTIKFYKKINDKAFKYFDTERKYYKGYGGDTFLVSIVFEWIRKEDRLKKAFEWNNKDDGLTDFYQVFYLENSEHGLMVYGHVQLADNPM